ncbi:hypothetical protein [Haloactinomyces albus]|uniref:Uncharacterized protein n=1 Tax=Haloactinomyces albus TaxID=1352928 RepID=A0AAE3ZA95_9ACTN|nr:hypothetical protein [Haloactinomyces albus]MDR7300200.1 hypothetical protein [Haloactinomyces albus]
MNSHENPTLANRRHARRAALGAGIGALVTADNGGWGLVAGFLALACIGSLVSAFFVGDHTEDARHGSVREGSATRFRKVFA